MLSWFKTKWKEVEEKLKPILMLILVGGTLFAFVHFLNYYRNFYFNQEVFDLNEVPAGVVIWVYPKDKGMHPLLPDSLKNKKLIDTPLYPDEEVLNYNVDVWEVGIHNHYNQIVKIEVPDYAIVYFPIGKEFRPKEKEEFKYPW